ncbi:MAG: 50S ribosomal protein L18 [Candidatus Caldarchaeum sp.]|nr:50S ribosomal protein L18 [Candidatus Caldarchaeum sp.]MDW7977926.1 50S ribosomal protein L18 [Candidatus Caldarchaeum sp.]MDW8360434.1 50S ribosomal protein L18 [Candidatus Caldarchaeum sp.]
MSSYLFLRTKPRRRRQGKTDYRKRLKLVKSGVERLVVRRTNRRLIAQLVRSKAGGDQTMITVSSDMLASYGWKASFKSTPAAYLTGVMLGKKALEKGFKEAILDMGVYRSVKGSRIYAVLKGVLDAGLHVPASEEMLPDEDRIRGRHITKYYPTARQNTASPLFSRTDEQYIQKLEENVVKVKQMIMEGSGDE